MDHAIVISLIAAVLWLLIITSWIFLIVTGLEVDKPLSGGIPGQTNAYEENNAPPEGWLGRLGIVGGWVVCGTALATLPYILWWIYVLH